MVPVTVLKKAAEEREGSEGKDAELTTREGGHFLQEGPNQENLGED